MNFASQKACLLYKAIFLSLTFIYKTFSRVLNYRHVYNKNEMRYALAILQSVIMMLVTKLLLQNL